MSDPNDPTRRICLWSGPRTRSTALMYAFAQRSDTTVVDEPLYAHYLTSTDAGRYHPGAEEVIADQRSDGERVVEEVILGAYETPVVFFKQMTHHLVDLDWRFLGETCNLILTRDPREVLLSYAEQVERPTMQDVGYARQLELLEYLKKRGKEPMVLDSNAVLKDPEARLSEVCAHLGIPFDEDMLSWQAGPRPEDGVWAPYWYESVHRSTGFQPYTPKTGPVPEHLEHLLDECETIYAKLVAEE